MRSLGIVRSLATIGLMMVFSVFVSSIAQAQPWYVNTGVYSGPMNNKNDTVIQPKWSDHLDLKDDWNDAMDTKFEPLEIANARFQAARAAYVAAHTTVPSNLELTIQENLDVGYIYQVIGDLPDADYNVGYAEVGYDDAFDAYKAIIDSAFSVGYPTQAERDTKVSEIEAESGYFYAAADTFETHMQTYANLAGRKPFYSFGSTNYVPCTNQPARFQSAIDALNTRAAALEAAL